MTALVHAAGGLVWRSDPDGPRVCLVHRPRYGDWSLPKGKLRPGEHPLAAAVREVAEETGLRAIPQLPLPPARYRVRGAPKRVEYWAMPVAEDAGGPAGSERASRSAYERSGGSERASRSAYERSAGSEVDQLAWLPAPAAAAQVSYDHDAALLRRWAAMPPVTGVILLVRPAQAGAAGALSQHGRARAAALCRLLALFAPDRLLSAPPRSCVQTLAPLAADQALPVAVDPDLDDHAAGPPALSGYLRPGAATVICAPGTVVAPAIAALVTADASGGADRSYGIAVAEGDGWLLPFSGPRPLAVSRLRSG